MKKIYLGSSKLQNNFKMIRIRYNYRHEVDSIKEGVMNLMGSYLQTYGGKLINVVDLENCKELLIYFVTGKEQPHPQW